MDLSDVMEQVVELINDIVINRRLDMAEYARNRLANLFEGLRAGGHVDFGGDAYDNISVTVNGPLFLEMNMPVIGNLNWPLPTTIEIMEASIEDSS